MIPFSYQEMTMEWQKFGTLEVLNVFLKPKTKHKQSQDFSMTNNTQMLSQVALMEPLQFMISDKVLILQINYTLGQIVLTNNYME